VFDEESEFDLSIDSINKLKNIVISIMNKFKDDLQEYATKEYYLATNEYDKLIYDDLSNLTLKEELNELG